jgi:hypothetical protein
MIELIKYNDNSSPQVKEKTGFVCNCNLSRSIVEKKILIPQIAMMKTLRTQTNVI